MSSDRLTNVLLGIIALILVGAALIATQTILIPIVLAVGLSAIVYPAVMKLSKFMPQGVALTLVILLMGGLIFGGGSLFALSIDGISARIPDYTLRFEEMFQGVIDFASSYGVNVSWDQVGTEETLSWAMEVLKTAFGSILNIVGQIFLILLMMVFLTLEAKVFRRKLETAFADTTRFRIARSLNSISTKIQQYVVTKTLISLLTGVSTSVVTAAIGVDFPIFWGGIAFMLNFIPNVGSIIAVIPPVLIALLQFSGFLEPMLTLILLTTVQLIIGNALEPRMLGKSLQLSAFVVLLSMIAWGWLWGIVGVVISVPLTVAVKIICENIEALRPIAVFLSDAPELTPLRKEAASIFEPLPSLETHEQPHGPTPSDPPAEPEAEPAPTPEESISDEVLEIEADEEADADEEVTPSKKEEEDTDV